jgi:hypothetical protein
MYQLKVYGADFFRVASVKAAMNGFHKIGIFPLQLGVFPEWAFDHRWKPYNFRKRNSIS